MAAARTILRDESYNVSQGLPRPCMRSVIRIPAMVPWVRPTPESPVTIKIFGSPGFLPMNASPSALFIIWPDQRNSGSPTSPKWGSLAKCVWASHATSSHCPRPHRRYFHRRKLIPQTPNVPSSLHPLNAVHSSSCVSVTLSSAGISQVGFVTPRNSPAFQCFASHF